MSNVLVMTQSYTISPVVFGIIIQLNTPILSPARCSIHIYMPLKHGHLDS